MIEPTLPIERPAADMVLTQTWLPFVQRVAGTQFVAREPRQAAADVVAAATAPRGQAGLHIHLANAYSLALADTTPAIADVFGSARGWLLPDGRPLTWISALRRDTPRLHQVRGPQFMLDVADLGREHGLRHYLLGGSPEVLEQLAQKLEDVFPGIDIVGAVSPPFTTPTAEDLRERDAAILASGAQVVWVGLGTPKQDYEAKRLAESLPVVALAVGAAFDYAAGALRPAPHWVSVAGVEWLWRLLAEPRRLWKRYTVGNAQFIRAVVRDELRSRRGLGETGLDRTTVVGQLPPPLHGSAVMTVRLIETLETLGHRVATVDRRFSRSTDEVGRFGLRKLVAVPSLLARFAVAAKRSDQVVHLITSTPASFLIDTAMLSLTRRPVVLYVHTVGFTALAERGRVWRALVRRAFARATDVVALGPSLLEDLAPFVPRSRMVEIHNAVPTARPRLRTGGARVLFLSNLLPGKGADVFVRMAHELVKASPDTPWRFHVAGAGDPLSLGTLPEEVTVHGRVDGATKEALLQSADVLVVPSTYAMEAQPLVIVEALAHGLPVVAYDNGGIRDLVDDTVGALVRRGDEHALAAAVMALVRDPERARAASEAAVQRFERRHSMTSFASAWQLLLSDSARVAPVSPAASVAQPDAPIAPVAQSDAERSLA